MEHTQQVFTRGSVGIDAVIPKMKCKAANAMAIVTWLADMPHGSNAVRGQLFRALARQWRLLHEHVLHFRPWQSRCVHRDGLRVLFCSKLLFLRSRAAGSRRWSLLPKHHQYGHLIRNVLVSNRNPGSHWCFADERYVGTIKRVIPNLRPGRRKSSLRVLQRHSFRLRLSFAGRAVSGEGAPLPRKRRR